MRRFMQFGLTAVLVGTALLVPVQPTEAQSAAFGACQYSLDPRTGDTTARNTLHGDGMTALRVDVRNAESYKLWFVNARDMPAGAKLIGYYGDSSSPLFGAREDARGNGKLYYDVPASASGTAAAAFVWQQETAGRTPPNRPASSYKLQSGPGQFRRSGGTTAVIGPSGIYRFEIQSQEEKMLFRFNCALLERADARYP